jgi:hypothetical protein
VSNLRFSPSDLQNPDYGFSSSLSLQNNRFTTIVGECDPTYPGGHIDIDSDTEFSNRTNDRVYLAVYASESCVAEQPTPVPLVSEYDFNVTRNTTTRTGQEIG